MKRSLVLALVVLVGFAAMAQASVLSFSWGTSFIQMSTNAITAAPGGTTGSLAWYADDLSVGFSADSFSVTDPNRPFSNSGTISVAEMTLDKWLSKSVAVGLGIGSVAERNDDPSSNRTFSFDGSGTAVDIRGTVQLLSGKGDKINASMDFTISERFINVPGQETRWPTFVDISSIRATVATLGVTIGL